MKSIIEHIKEYLKPYMNNIRIKALKDKIAIIKEEPHELKRHTYRIVAGTSIIAVTFFWLGTRNNAYAVVVDNQVVAVVKAKEEVAAALENVVTTIKAEKGVDIAVNEAVSIEPVKSKAEDISSTEQVVQALSEAVSYDVEAYEIVVDGKERAVVESKEVASKILKEIAEKQLPEYADVTLKIEAIEDKTDAIAERTVAGEDASKTNAVSVPISVPEVADIKAVEPTPEATNVPQIAAAPIPESNPQTTEKPKNTSTPEATSVPEDTSTPESTSTPKATSMPEGTSTPEATSSPELLVVPESTSAPKVDASPVITPIASPSVTGENKKVELVEVAEALPEAEIKNKVSIGDVKVDIERAKEVLSKQPKSTVKKEIKDFNFNEDVIIKNIYINQEHILSEEEALDILLSNTEEVVEYTLKEGDNIWDIAVKNDTTMDHILEINPQITDETKMQIGETIKLEVPDPILSIATVEEATFKEIIPGEIKYVEDNELYKNETKVKEEGHDGSRELTVLVERINGKEVNRTLITEKVLREPKEKVIAYGTKKKPRNMGGDSVSSANTGEFMHPLNGGGRISSDYGYRGGSFHKGLDIAAPAGTPVYASASGKVIYSGYNSGGYGKLVIIDHGNGYQTYYGHNSSLYVQTGQSVSKGQNIAGVGSTGNSSGNHVHFEIRRNGTPINPYNSVY